MLDIYNSTATDQNESLLEKPPPQGSNLRWLEQQFRTLEKGATCPYVLLLLVGGSDTVSARLRYAQAPARQDLTPSHWSHVVLVEPGESQFQDAHTTEVSLNPPAGFGFPAPTNAIQTGVLTTYNDPQTWPNLALLAVPVPPEQVKKRLASLRSMRCSIDLVELTIRWLGYLWGVRHADNPLTHEAGIPSAVMLENVIGALGFDLTPGLASRSSCPEAIWQSARWWHQFHSQVPRSDGSPQPLASDEERSQPPISGAFTITHRLP